MTVKLDAQEEERAMRLHRESISVDTLAGGPSLFTDNMVQHARKALAAGRSAISALLEAEDLLVREVAKDAAVRQQYAQAWEEAGVTCVSATMGGLGNPPFSFRAALEAIARCGRLIDAMPERLMKATRAADVRRAKAEGKHAFLYNLQNTTHFDADMSKLELLYDLGVRIIQLTYNMRNFVGDGCTERTDSGLSHFGVQLVHRLNEMGVLVDLSHCGAQTSLDAARVSRRPVAFTHTFARALSAHDRGKADDLLKAIAATGGYIGVLVVPFFISDRADVTLETAIDHVEYIANLCGIDHVGIGTDWGAVFPREVADALNQEMGAIGFRPEHRVDWNFHLPDFRSWQEWPNITRRLVQRGFSDADVQKVLGLNFLRVFAAAVG